MYVALLYKEKKPSIFALLMVIKERCAWVFLEMRICESEKMKSLRKIANFNMWAGKQDNNFNFHKI